MEQDFEDAGGLIDLIVACERELRFMVENNAPKGDISAVARLIASKAQRLSDLRNNLLDGSLFDGDGNDDANSNRGSKTPFFTIPELRFVSWMEASSLESPPTEHVTIQIPRSQPMPEELIQGEEGARVLPSSGSKKTPSDSDPKHKALEEANKPTKEFKRSLLPTFDSPVFEELPDRIRICSQRLTLFLDYNIHDTTFNWSSYERTPFIILRPFKFLVDKGKEIRTALADLERIRLERFPYLSEGEYDELWKATRPEDDFPPRMVNPTELGVAELTALIKDLHCLTRFMDGYIEPAMMTRQQDHVFFSDLWFVYPARSLIYIKDKKVPHKIWKVIQRTGGRWGYKTPRKGPTGDYMDSTQCFSPFVIDCFHLDYDGARYVHTYRQIQIDHFEGHQPVMSLPAIPIDVAQKAGFVDRQALVKRGKEFVECTQPSHRQYAGRNQIMRPNGAKLHDVEIDIPENATRHAEWIESEVMVDFERALQEMPGWRPGINDLELYKTKEEVKTYGGVEIDNVWDSKLSEHVLYEEWTKIQLWDKARTHPTDDEDLLLLPDRVFAFVFRTRKWACLRIGTDKDSQETLTVKHRRKEPWLHLQLPDGHKRLIQSLVESHSADRGSSNVEFDLIRAKGKGLIILLHGVPGVGKTSTAECAAEAYNRPLLPITCGDLGSSPREVEKKLDEAFQLAQLWDCVLLLDEADIFLAQRSENDIARNALVSVFLRVLEYYEGILFLTTNRVGVFDEAFKSRIHLPLYYPPLEWKFAEQIWCTCLERLASSTVVEFDKEDILAYAETFFDKQNAKNSKIGPVWNGRQIRNAFQSAVALAGYQRAGDRFRLEREHFERVSKVSNEFNYYIWSIKTETDADKASRWGFRYDAFEVDETIHMKSVQPVAPTGMGGITFRPQFGNPGSIGMPLMNNPSQGPLQQGSFFNGMVPQPGAGPAGFTGMSNPITNPTGGIIGSHLSQTGQGQLNQQFQQQAYQQQAYQQPTQQAYQQPTQQAYQQPLQLAHQQH